MNQKITSLLAVSALSLSGCSDSSSVQESSAKSNKIETKYCVTLGDSISAGYGLTDAEHERYTTLLTEKLKSTKEKWVDCNYAVSGDDSTDLIKRLHDGKAVRLPAADMILLYIGANNTLGPYSEYLAAISAPAVSNEKLLQAKEVLDKGIEEGHATLQNDLKIIYDWIRERNAKDHAKIYLMSIYNPFFSKNDVTLPATDITFSAYAQTVTERSNQILSDFASAHDDIIFVDIAPEYEKCEKMPINGQIADASEWAIDPHPTAEGHKIIADTIYDVIEANRE